MRHAGEFSRPLVLDECDASLLLDLCQAQRPVGPETRENDADGSAAVLLRQRSKEMIDRHVRPTGLAAGRQLEYQTADGYVDVGRET
ncbi:MAG TPA: hypothetical protein VLK82_09325 [Candidatus Tectomicrobia bacterium]|nr:hypothetical protein [Candidatus Tectomicrobia bacterium]